MRPFATKIEARAGLERFIRTCVNMRDLELTRMRLHESMSNLYDFAIAPDYLISQWLDDTKVNTDLKNNFRQIITSSPFLTEEEPITKEHESRSEFTIAIEGEPTLAYGLGSAYLLETVCMSLLSQDLWDSEEIQHVKYYLLYNNGSETTDTIRIKHVSQPTHVALHQSWFEEKKRESLQKGKDLWEKRAEFFPHLSFCSPVKQQLIKIGVQSKYFDQIIEKLKQLDQYAETWSNGAYNIEILRTFGVTVSGESKTTLRKYGALRTFRLPHGQRKVFEEHLKIIDSWRIHFYPDNDTHTIYVGYIGKHLPI
ncbi:MAG: hypothetical protein KAH77_11760 [Thiomargarita sp.]|nr:hypothetical protein [Thiomargarita sp.]